MELALRRGHRRWPGLGDPLSDAVDASGLIIGSDPSLIYTDPGTGITTTPGIDLTADQLAIQQAAAEAWLLQNVPASSGFTPAQALTALSTLALTSAQIANGLQAGTVQTSPACPSGYRYSTGVCVPAVQGASSSGSLISGVSNQTLALVGIGFLFLMMMSGGGKRR